MAITESKRMYEEGKKAAPDANRDPLSGAPGAHPVGVGLGAAAGGAIGTAAAIGMATVGPVGAVVGAAIGAVAGGLAGKAGGEAVNPTDEAAYWRDNFVKQPYYDSAHTYDDYGPAYQYGWESRGRHAGKSYDEAESDLDSGWAKAKQKSTLGWEKAKNATRDAWNRVEDKIPGDSDRDGH